MRAITFSVFVIILCLSMSSTLVLAQAPNLAPVAGDATFTTLEDTAFSEQLTGSDPESGSIIFAIVSNGQKGTAALSNAETGTFTYTPNLNVNGTDTFTFVVNDGQVDSNIATVTVNITSVDDMFVVKNMVLDVAKNSTTNFTLDAYDPEGEACTGVAFLQNIATKKGNVANLSGLLCRYSTSLNVTGTEVLQYQVSEQHGESSWATITVNIIDALPPVAVNGTVSTDEDTPVNGTLSASDPAGYPLTYSIVSHGTKGTVEITDQSTGAYTYTPNQDANGSSSFTFKANNGLLNSNTATVTVTINPVNDPPVAYDDVTGQIQEDAVMSFYVLSNDIDVDNILSQLSVIKVTDTTHGTLTIGADNRHFNYTPTANWSGTDSFTYKVFDGNAESNIATVYITYIPVNDKPVGVPDAYTTDEDTTLTVTAPGVLANDYDVEGDPLTAQFFGWGPYFGAVTVNADGSFSYTPNADFNGTDLFFYRVSDNKGASSSLVQVQITVNPVNDPPVASPGTLAVDENSADNPGTLVAADVDEDALTYSIVANASHGTAAITNAATGAYTYTPAADYSGDDSFTFVANDGTVDSNTATVSITVTAIWTVTPGAGAHGAISPDTPQSVRNNLGIEFTATPDTGYVVDKWLVDDVEAQAGGTSFTLSNVTADHAVQVTFKIATFTVTGNVEGTGGTIDPSGDSSVDYGDYLFLTATPDSGYGVQKWQVDDSDVQTGGLTYELNNVTANHNVKVFFSEYDAPTVAGITPNTHVNSGRLLVTDLAGTGFRTGVTAQLTKTGEPCITATNVVVVSGTQITCDFNFMSNAIGAWNVVVTNDDGKSATLADAVTLTLAPPAIASITPNTGVNTGSVAITDLAGSGFDNATVELRRTGETAIPMTGIILFGPTKITGSFDLTGATPGAWDLVVANGDSQSATLTNGFTIGAEPAPAPASISPATVQKPGIKTLTINGAAFADDATVTLTKSGETDLELTMTSRTATQLKGTIDITGQAVGQWNVVVTNHPGEGGEQSATLPNALAIVEAALTGVTLDTDKAWPQPTGATITLAAAKTGTATNVEYQFWVKTLNRLTSLPEYVMLRDYDTADTFAWKPISDNSYWLYVYAREVGSGVPFQVASPEVYYKIEAATLTKVTLAVLPLTSPQPVNTTFNLTATKSGTAVDVEYQFVYKWYNTATSKWVDGYIRGYEANNTCTWTPTVAGNYRLYVMARIVGSTALFDRISTYKAYTINP